MASPNLLFVEIAANLTDPMFSGVYNDRTVHPPDLPHVLNRASAAGVARTLVTAGTLAQSSEALALARAHPTLYSTVGVHPTRASEMSGRLDAAVDDLIALVATGADTVVAVGECGLDFDRLHFCDKETQGDAFLAQFRLAEATGLPMFLHDRNSGGEFARVVRENRARFGDGVVHSFTGSVEDLAGVLDCGLYVGVNGCSLKTKANLEAVKAIPLDRIMLETDAPWCGIRRTHAGFGDVQSVWEAKDKKKWSEHCVVKGRAEPCHIRQVCEVVATVKGIEPEVLARSAYNNSFKVFFPSEVEGPSPYDLAIGAMQ